MLEPQPWRFQVADVARAAGARASFALYFSACGASTDEVMRAEHAVGELLGNVVRHAPGPVEIELARRAGIPYLSVSDRGSKPFESGDRLAPPTLAGSGRGLVMLGEFGMVRVVRRAREAYASIRGPAVPGERARKSVRADSGSEDGRLGSRARS